MDGSFRVVGINDSPENTGTGISDLGNQFIIHIDTAVGNDKACPRFLQLGETPHLDFIANALVKRSDLAVKGNLAAS
jgi:hypothetical protein